MSPLGPTVSNLNEPGMFRRNFLQTRARRLGNPEPPLLTRNFIDFLVLYGFYGGDVLPEDETDYYSQDDSPRGMGGEEGGSVGDQAPLLRNSRNAMARVKGTSESKAFFMLSKAFVGTGVLFLPVLHSTHLESFLERWNCIQCLALGSIGFYDAALYASSC